MLDLSITSAMRVRVAIKDVVATDFVVVVDVDVVVFVVDGCVIVY